MSGDSDWKSDAVEAAADLARERIGKERSKTTSGVKERALDKVEAAVDRAEETAKSRTEKR